MARKQSKKGTVSPKPSKRQSSSSDRQPSPPPPAKKPCKEKEESSEPNQKVEESTAQPSTSNFQEGFLPIEEEDHHEAFPAFPEEPLGGFF